MSEPASASNSARSDEQLLRERAAQQVSDVLLNLEGVLAHAKRARKVVTADGVDTNAELALTDAIKDFERIHKRLLQDTYFAVDTRLI